MMYSTKFKFQFHYITAIFVVMAVVPFIVISFLPEDIDSAWRCFFYAFALIFVLFLLYRLVFSTRKLYVSEDGILQVKRFFGLIKDAEVSLKKFDGYRLEYVHAGRGGKDIYGYFCLVKQDKVCAKVCFNSYDEFFDFLETAVNPHLKKITHYGGQEEK